jgi:hypothetical protein
MESSDDVQAPLSTQQQMWCAYDGRAFDSRWVNAIAFRISGQLRTTELQRALNDVVARHEVLRTKVVRDADPPYQQVHPPSPVPLSVRWLPERADRSRDLQAEHLLLEGEQSTLDVDDLPLMRAIVGKFDDRDAVLTLITHHSAVDGWSTELIIRDLAESYAAAVADRPPVLPPLKQYREYAAWEQGNATGGAASANLEYWRRKLDGASYFALPTDRPTGRTRRYITSSFEIEAGTGAAVSKLAKSTRATTFMVLLSAFNVLAHEITGTTGHVINVIANGRGNPRFRETVGPFLNFLPLRTDLGACDSFRQVIDNVRVTCLEAYAHEIPIQDIEEDLPGLLQPMESGTVCDTIFGYFSRPFSSGAVQIADGAHQIRRQELKDVTSSQLPGGAAWTMTPATLDGRLTGRIEFNLDEFDEATIAAWSQAYRRILARVVAEPDRPWKTL